MEREEQTHNILFLQSDPFCYDSAVSFQENIAKEFAETGFVVRQISCPKEDALPILKSLYGQSYDIIFDINSLLPSIRDEDGEYCMNHIHGQVWHYILDHPLYHHEVLNCPLDDFCVICPDEKHAAFIRQYYPHIKQAICLPLGALPAEKIIPFSHRNYDVLFTGTYTDSHVLLYQAAKLPLPQRKIFEQVVELLLDKPELTQEEALSTFLDSSNFIEEGQAIFLFADMYLRASIREEALFQLLQRGISVTVYGHHWEKFLANCKNKLPEAEKLLHICGEVSYHELPEIYADAKIAFNVLPWFKAGMHDRIPLALMNGCVCVTDESSYLESHFVDGEQLYLYSLEEMGEMADMTAQLLEDTKASAKTAARGYAYAVRHLTWKHWLETFLKLRKE
jgi:glycosyltransferase involved in cell wall biosynthesis